MISFFIEVKKMGTTIAAISTPLGEGGIGTVRISGECAREIADKIFKSKSGKRIADAKGYTALFGAVYEKENMLDEAVALVFSAPKSYTGEDVVELSVHGGVYVTRALLRAALSAGAVAAAAGEFTLRAFQNGKMKLSEAESVMALIGAKGEQELKMALESKTGRVYREIEEIKNELLAVEAAVAVFTDYPDEDLPEADAENVKDKLLKIKEALKKLLANFSAGKVIREGISTAIIGAPNVGKSTLMNMLTGDERSIVTCVAGTTRDIIEETVRVGEVTLRLADTAGVHQTGDEVETIGVDLACKKATQSQLILAVFDGTKALDGDDKEILKLIEDKTAIVVINKADKETVLKCDEFLPRKAVFLSAKTGEGRQALIDAITECSGANNLDPDAAVLINERQRDCAQRAYDNVCEALRTKEAGFTLDAVGICADEALSNLLELTGERVTEAVTREVFSRFCVGK